jgi:hypothetical protein
VQTNSRLAWQLLAGVVIIVLVGLTVQFPIFPGKSKSVRGPQTMSLANGRVLATACKLYASDHDGRFPIHLSELDPDYIEGVKSLRGVAFGPDAEAQYRYDWLYFGAGFTASNPPTVLLASPLITVTPGKLQNRIVIKGDATGAVLGDEQYEKLLTETVRQVRDLDDHLHPVQPTPAESSAK